MQLTALRYVLAIVEHGSIAAAARALGVSQPSLSKSVARLEDELKGRIFVRGAAGAALTPFGEVVAEQASRVVREARNLQQAALLSAGGASSLLRIGVGPEFKRTLAPQLLEAILGRWPSLNVRLEVGDRLRLLPALQARELDVIFTIQDPAVDAAAELTSPLLVSAPVVVAAPGHPLAGRRGLTRDDFLAHPHGGPRNAFFTTESYFGAWRGERAAPGYELSDYEPFLPLVLAGKATLGLPAFAAAPYVAAGDLVRIDLPLERRLEYVGVTTPAARTSPIVLQVLQQAQAIGRALEAAAASLR